MAMQSLGNLNFNSLVNKARDKLEQYRGSDLEKKVKEATSSENWGVSSTIKDEIARATYDYQVRCGRIDEVWFDWL